jgi:gluconolactonase
MLHAGLWAAAARGAMAADTALPNTVAEGAALVQVYAAERFFEGPTWDPATQKLLFASFKKQESQILRLDGDGKAAVWLDKSQGVNGTRLSRDGRLLGAHSHGVLIHKIGIDGPLETQVLLNDMTLNEPNDLCQTPGGEIYFTDPDFKTKQKSAVYRLASDGKISKLTIDMPLPNGIITSLDGKTLYVGDSHEKLWRSFPILEDGGVGAGKVFFNPDTQNAQAPDGMTIDERGNLYLSGRGGVWVVNPGGQALGLIAVPEFCSNVAFGGNDGKTLFLTCSKKVYSLQMTLRGGQFSDKR